MSTATQMIARTGVPSRAVRTSLNVIRFPLTAVERVTGRRGSAWGPAAGFAMVEATVLQTFADLLHDEALAAEGRRKQAGAAKAQRAAEVDADALRSQEQADQKHAERTEAADEFADRAGRRAAEQQDKTEQEAAKRREQAERAAQQRSTRARERAGETQEGLRHRERADRLATAKDREEALETEIAAVDAEEKVLHLDDRIERSRETRKARRSS